MSGRRQVEELLQGLHAARIEGSLERVCACFSPDARLRIAGSSDGKPIAIAAAGISQIRPWLGILVKTFRLSGYELRSLTIEGTRAAAHWRVDIRSEEHTSELQSRVDLVCRLLLEKKKKDKKT